MRIVQSIPSSGRLRRGPALRCGYVRHTTLRRRRFSRGAGHERRGARSLTVGTIAMCGTTTPGARGAREPMGQHGRARRQNRDQQDPVARLRVSRGPAGVLRREIRSLPRCWRPIQTTADTGVSQGIAHHGDQALPFAAASQLRLDRQDDGIEIRPLAFFPPQRRGDLRLAQPDLGRHGYPHFSKYAPMTFRPASPNRAAGLNYDD